MQDIYDLFVKQTFTIQESLKVIDRGGKRIALVVEEDNTLLGTLNDGDIRRALLSGKNLSDSIESVYHRNPYVCNQNDSNKTIIKTAIKKQVYQIPIVDDNNKLVKVVDLATLMTNVNKSNKVVLMAGGLGTRLRPLTENTPKPLLKVGSKAILEIIIENFASYGFVDIIISVNYKANMIKDYFKDGSKFGVNITYIEENKRLGTAGALSLIKEKLNKPFFVMNADLLTNVNFEQLLDFHSFGNSDATMCVREYDYQIPYGVIQTKEDNIISIEEKPIQKFFVNAGIYLLSPRVLDYIPKDDFFDMPTLYEKLIEDGKKVLSFPIHEYWLDIGRMSDFHKAQDEYSMIFNS